MKAEFFQFIQLSGLVKPESVCCHWVPIETEIRRFNCKIASQNETHKELLTFVLFNKGLLRAY